MAKTATKPAEVVNISKHSLKKVIRQNILLYGYFPVLSTVAEICLEMENQIRSEFADDKAADVWMANAEHLQELIDKDNPSRATSVVRKSDGKRVLLRSENHPTALWSNDRAKEIRDEVAFTIKQGGKKSYAVEKVAAREKCSVNAVYDLICGRTYKNAGGTITKEKRRASKK